MDGVPDQTALDRASDLRERYDQLLELSPDAIAVHQLGRIVYANPAAARFACLHPNQMVGRLITDFVHPDSVQDMLDRLATMGSAPGAHTGPDAVQMVDATGAVRAMEVTSVRIAGSDPTWQVILRDVSALKAAEQELLRRTRELEWQTTHDSLTGLHSRSSTVEGLQRFIVELREESDRVCVFYLDLIGFKALNDSAGHAAGDELLRSAARRLVRAAPAALVGRIGGDEFVIVTHTTAHDVEDHLRMTADSTHRSLGEPIDVNGQTLRVAASIGVDVVGPADGRGARDILRDADIAQLRAKVEPRQSYVRFHARHRETLQRRQRLIQDLRSALAVAATPHLHLQYQPIVGAADGSVMAVEALLRWTHPDLGVIAPSEFLPLARRDPGTMVEMTTAVLRLAVSDARLNELPRQGIKLHVNVSAPDLLDPGFVERVLSVLADEDFAPEGLCLEIGSTSAVIDDGRQSVRTLDALRMAGIGIALDDFGAAGVGLAELHLLPATTIKTAKDFARRIDAHRTVREILGGIVGIAHAAGLAVVGQGVESSRQAHVFAGLGCDALQGFFHAVPTSLATAVRVQAEPRGRAEP